MTVGPTGATAALRSLSERYARAADRRDEAAFAGVFDADAVLSVYYPGRHEPSRSKGLEEIRKACRRLSRFRLTMHLLGQSVFDVEADEATGEIYCVAHHLHAERVDIDYVLHIRYEDRYRFDAERWTIARREVNVLWTETRTIDVPGSG